MKTRLTLPLTVAFALLLAAFSTGSPIFLFGGALILLAMLSALIAVAWASRTMTVSSGLSGRAVSWGAASGSAVSITEPDSEESSDWPSGSDGESGAAAV